MNDILCREGIRVTVNVATLKCGPLGYRNSCKQKSDDDDDGTLTLDPPQNLQVRLFLEALPSEENYAFPEFLSQSGFAAARGSGGW